MTWYVLLLFHYYHFSVAFVLVLGEVQAIGKERRFIIIIIIIIIIKVVVLSLYFLFNLAPCQPIHQNYLLALIVTTYIHVHIPNFSSNVTCRIACIMIYIT